MTIGLGAAGAFRRLRAPALAALAVKFMGALFSFIATLVVARAAGAAVSGEYALGFQTVLTLSVLALAGLDQILLRTMAGDLREGHKDRAYAALRQTVRVVALGSVLLAILLAVASPLADIIGAGWYVFVIAALALLFYPLLRLAVSALRASGSIVLSQFFDGPLHSGLLALAVGVAAIAGLRLDGATVLLIFAASIACASLIAWMAVRRATASWPRSAGRRHARPLNEGWPILLTVGTHMLTGWLLMALVGAHEGPVQVGAFRVAIQIVTIIAMILTTVESIVNPQYAGDFRVADHARARRRHRRATLLLLIGAGPPSLVCLLFPDALLSLFGPEFVIGAAALQVLAIGQIVNIATGPIGGMLVMAGRERTSLVLGLIGLVLAIGIASLTIPAYGLTGAAIGHAAGLIFRNVASYILVFRSPALRGLPQ